MCGICGFYNFDQRPAQEATLRLMCSRIQHRGPDDEGVYTDGHFGMGMRRLSIIDLDTGHQPLSNEDGTVWTVFNGEIYNYLELREDLQKLGHRFRTRSDTEVLVHLYEQHGADFLRHLRGMFALAIWDTRKQELLLARDPLGIKQLYLCAMDTQVIFASEIKSILAVLEGQLQPDREALSQYLTFLYFPGRSTPFKGITKILPGHYLRINSQGVTEQEFWNLNRFSEISIDFDQACEELLRLVRESVRMHLRSDVPVGVFLSGGIDSSIVTAVAAEMVDNPLNTFTIGYGTEGSYFDERRYADLVARRFRTNHRELTVSPDIREALGLLIHAFDQPFANSSAIPNYYIAQMMSKHVKVALSGLGGDELAAGYERIAGMQLIMRMKHIPQPFLRALKGVVGRIPEAKGGGYLVNRLKRLTTAAMLAPEDAYYSIVASLSDERKQSIVGTGQGDAYDYYRQTVLAANQPEIIRSLLYFDLVSYMTNDLLTLTDITSMANSLEVRVPLIDQRLVEFMFSLPLGYKLRNLEKKYILKKVFRGMLPRAILTRQKRGFSTPIAVWLRGGLREYAGQILSRERVGATGLLNPDGVQGLFEEHLTRRANHQGILFALMTLVLWHENYIQQRI